MKIYVIASAEYEANMPDLFLMDKQGNYYGVSNHSYAEWHNFPKDVEHWRNAEGSDAGRHFFIDEVEADAEKVEMFDDLTKQMVAVDASVPKFGETSPSRSEFKSSRAFDAAFKEFDQRYKQWTKEAKIGEYIEKINELAEKRVKVFLGFSDKVAYAISDNDYIKKSYENVMLQREA